MRKGFLIIAAIFYSLSLQAQSPMNCCSPTQRFALLATDKNFRAAHEAPLPFIFQNAQGKMIQIPTSDGKTANAYFVKATVPTNNYLLVFHEWWGLNDYIRQMCDQLQHDLQNINVIGLDLYDGKIATTPDEAGKLMQAVSDKRARAIIAGGLKYAGSDARFYTIGWCFGGGWSLQATLMAGKQAEGCVMYYGLPEKDVATLRTLHCDVLGIFANKDDWITPALVDEFAANMKKAGKSLTVHRYDAYHGFANPSGPHHNGKAAKEAYDYTLQFLKARIH